jgi:hypothetical protein
MAARFDLLEGRYRHGGEKAHDDDDDHDLDKREGNVSLSHMIQKYVVLGCVCAVTKHTSNNQKCQYL